MSSATAIAPAPFSVDGKTAIVTGAGSGINLAFARLLISHNCNVVLADLSLRPEAEDLIASTQNSGPRAVFLQTDVTDWTALTRMFDFTLAEFGDFDILCPGAGVYEPDWSSFWHPPGSAASKDDAASGRYALLDINLTQPIRSTQLAISHWLYPRAPSQDSSTSSKFTAPPEPVSPQNPKRVVHISSVAGQLPSLRAPMYGATKHAISGFVRCLAPLQAELGVAVTAVAPGVVKTPLWTENPDKLANVDQARDAWVTPEEVADAMLRCVEKEAGGTVLEVGAGSTRPVRILNDPGPDMSPQAGLITSNNQKGNDLVWASLRDPEVWGGL